MNRGDWGFDQLGDSGGAAQCVDDLRGDVFHARSIATIASISQEQSCDNRFCDIRSNRQQVCMDTAAIKERMDRLGIKAAVLANALHLTPDKISKVFGGDRQWRGDELIRAIQFLDEIEGGQHAPDLPQIEGRRDYLEIEILPSFAGMGGGGNGEGEPEIGLVPRRLVEDELRAKPADLLLIETRGSSMEPDFLHGDQILIDRRDRNPVQPGSFALWDRDGYVIKLVERVPMKKGWYRIFSANGRYTAYEVAEEDITIMGRPVWFARRL